jgi:hypothetical protein
LYAGSPAVRLLKIAHLEGLGTPNEVRIYNAFDLLRERYKKIFGESPFFSPEHLNDELVALISAYLGFTTNPHLPIGDEEKYLRQCDEVIMFSSPELANECGLSVDTFRQKYVNEP